MPISSIKGMRKKLHQLSREWAFQNTPFNILYSYMKADNAASCATARSIGMTQVDEYTDSENERTKVHAVTRDRLKNVEVC